MTPKEQPATTLTPPAPQAKAGAGPAGMPRTGAGELRDQALLVLLAGLLLLALGGFARLTKRDGA